MFYRAQNKFFAYTKLIVLHVTGDLYLVTDLRVVCKNITCVPAVTEMAIIFLEIVKAAAGRDTQGFRLRHCGRLPSHYSDGQEHKITWRARPEQDTIFFLRVTGSVQRARQPLSRRTIRERTTTELTTFILWPLNLPVMRACACGL